MPIQFQCEHCGYTLTVSSQLAGKTGKCPKCQNKVLVPAEGKPAANNGNPNNGTAAVGSSKSTQPQVKSSQPKESHRTTSKVAGPTKVVKTATNAGTAKAPTPGAKVSTAVDAARMGTLLDEMGFVKKTGPTCPSCAGDIRPGTVVCTSCGYNFQTEKKVVGFDAKIERPEFDNLYLQQAVENMQRDQVTEQRREKSSMPWWVLASFLIGIAMLCGAGVVLVDANFGEPAPEDTRLGRIQRVPVLVILGATIGTTGLALALFSHLNICTFAFQRKLLQGAACFFLPVLYSLPFGIMNWTDNKAPIKGFILAIVFIGAGVGLILWGGGFGKLNGVL